MSTPFSNIRPGLHILAAVPAPALGDVLGPSAVLHHHDAVTLGEALGARSHVMIRLPLLVVTCPFDADPVQVLALWAVVDGVLSEQRLFGLLLDSV